MEANSKKVRRSPCDKQQRDVISLQFKILVDLVFQVDSEISGLLLRLQSCLLHDPAARPKSLKAILQAIPTPEHGNTISAENGEVADNNSTCESCNDAASESDNNNIDDENHRNANGGHRYAGDNSNVYIDSSNNNSGGDTNGNGNGDNKIREFFHRYALEGKEEQRLVTIAKSFLDGDEAKAAIEDFEKNYREHPRSFWNQFSEKLETTDDRESINKLLSILSSFDGFSNLARMLLSVAVNEKVDSMINSRNQFGGVMPKPGQSWRALALELSWGTKPTASQREKIRAGEGYRLLPAGILVGMKKPLWSKWGYKFSQTGFDALRAYTMTLKSFQGYLEISPLVENVRKSVSSLIKKRQRVEDRDEHRFLGKQSQQARVSSLSSVSTPRIPSHPQRSAGQHDHPVSNATGVGDSSTVTSRHIAPGSEISWDHTFEFHGNRHSQQPPIGHTSTGTDIDAFINPSRSISADRVPSRNLNGSDSQTAETLFGLRSGSGIINIDDGSYFPRSSENVPQLPTSSTPNMQPGNLHPDGRQNTNFPQSSSTSIQPPRGHTSAGAQFDTWVNFPQSGNFSVQSAGHTSQTRHISPSSYPDTWINFPQSSSTSIQPPRGHTSAGAQFDTWVNFPSSENFSAEPAYLSVSNGGL